MVPERLSWGLLVMKDDLKIYQYVEFNHPKGKDAQLPERRIAIGKVFKIITKETIEGTTVDVVICNGPDFVTVNKKEILCTLTVNRNPILV